MYDFYFSILNWKSLINLDQAFKNFIQSYVYVNSNTIINEDKKL
jgi:hypothetical protein